MNTPFENDQQSAIPTHATGKNAPYEPPCIESVLSSEDIEREVQYAGAPVGSVIVIA